MLNGDDMEDMEVLAGISETLKDAQTVSDPKWFFRLIAQARESIEILCEFESINTTQAEAYTNQVEGVIALYNLGLLAAKP
jgi:hypothetical protein